MRNFSRDKRRIEELKKKRHEEKQMKKLNKSQAPVVPPVPTDNPAASLEGPAE